MEHTRPRASASRESVDVGWTDMLWDVPVIPTERWPPLTTCDGGGDPDRAWVIDYEEAE
jgi:hypothetical protein